MSEKFENSQSQLEDFKLKYQKNLSEIAGLHKTIDILKGRLKTFEEQKRELEHLNDQWESSTRVLEYSKQDLEERLYQAEESVIMYKEELDEVSNAKEIEMQRLRDEVKDLRHEISILEMQHGDIAKIQDLEIALQKALDGQRALKDQIGKNVEEEEKCAKVAVYAKVRPLLQSDQCRLTPLCCDSSSIRISPVKEKGKSGPARVFGFSKVFSSHDSLDVLFKDLEPSISHFASGGCSCILSYGQTGSGKTFTMNGLMARSLELLDSIISNDSKVSFHCIEVYNEQVKNLLSDKGLSKNWKDIISISEIQVQGDWHTNVKKLIALASSKRSTKSTESNEYSSRSHCIYTFLLEMPGKTSTLQFVDLAGSERIAKSMVTGDALKETLHINKSLSALHDVVAALEAKSQHVPYRNSLLTRILKMSLASQESKISIILNCSPTEDSLNETISTLNLGLRLKSIDLSWAIRKNLKNEEVERTLSLLEKERQEKNALARKVEKYERDLESYSMAVKEKDAKFAQQSVKLKQIDKMYSDEIDHLKKEILIIRGKNEETCKKLTAYRVKYESEKRGKIVNPMQFTKTSLKKNLFSTLNVPVQTPTYSKSQNSSRIPRPNPGSCNTSKSNIIV